MRWSDFDIVRLVSLLLPLKNRRVQMVSWLNAVLVPLARLKDDILYKMQHDGRVIYLEKVLNEKLGAPGYDHQDHEATKVIIIGPGEIPEEVYIFRKGEPDDPVYLDDDEPYLHTQAEQDEIYCDFTVVLPLSFPADNRDVERLVDYYKMAGKKYKIVRV